MGDAGCFSFFPSKNLGGVGDGGMVLTAHAEVAERVQSLRGHGSRRKYFHDELGTNSRLDEMQAAVLRIKLRHLQSWNEKRRAVAAAYTQAISQFVQVPGDGPGCRHVYHQYTVRTSRRDALMDQLQKDGIGAIIYYPLALHQQKVYLDMGLGGQPLAETERAQREVLSLPMFPELNQSQIDQVISSLAGFFQNQAVQAG
jgi:dTDP-4-amino-4,6-dideoxygalactose transaminase